MFEKIIENAKTFLVHDHEKTRRERFGCEVVNHLDNALRRGNPFDGCESAKDARGLLLRKLKRLIPRKRFERYRYIAERMVRTLVDTLVEEGLRGLREDRCQGSQTPGN